jgi:hypothetical protein
MCSIAPTAELPDATGPGTHVIESPGSSLITDQQFGNIQGTGAGCVNFVLALVLAK